MIENLARHRKIRPHLKVQMMMIQTLDRKYKMKHNMFQKKIPKFQMIMIKILESHREYKMEHKRL